MVAPRAVVGKGWANTPATNSWGGAQPVDVFAKTPRLPRSHEMGFRHPGLREAPIWPDRAVPAAGAAARGTMEVSYGGSLEEVPHIFSQKSRTWAGFSSVNGANFDWHYEDSGFGDFAETTFTGVPTCRVRGFDKGKQHGTDDWTVPGCLGFAQTTLGDLPGGGAGSDPCWVTVFGFPGRAALLVQQQLEALYGPVLEVCHGDGNFMHVRFHSTAAASACLALNGHALLGRLLIGCVPCTSAVVVEQPRPAPATTGTVIGTVNTTPFAHEGRSHWRNTVFRAERDDELEQRDTFSLVRSPADATAPLVGAAGVDAVGWPTLRVSTSNITSDIRVAATPAPEVKTSSLAWRLLDLFFDL